MIGIVAAPMVLEPKPKLKTKRRRKTTTLGKETTPIIKPAVVVATMVARILSQVV